MRASGCLLTSSLFARGQAVFPKRALYIAEAKRFLTAAFPEFRTRGGGYLHDDAALRDWAHFGNDETYIALQQNRSPSARQDIPYTNDGINHVGFVVDNLDNVMQRLGASGYTPTSLSGLTDHPHRRRAYFIDGNTFEWEFIEYLSDHNEERHDYSV